MQSPSLLQQSINELELSEAFKQTAYRHDFRNLQDIINWPVSVLLMHQGFTYHIHQELKEFLNKNGFSHLLKTESLQPI